MTKPACAGYPDVCARPQPAQAGFVHPSRGLQPDGAAAAREPFAGLILGLERGEASLELGVHRYSPFARKVMPSSLIVLLIVPGTFIMLTYPASVTSIHPKPS